MFIKTQETPLRVAALAAMLTLPLATGAWAAGAHGGGHRQAPKIGAPGKSADVARTVTVIMTDNRFEPAVISVKKGQTVRFIIKNQGEFVHEFNIGTALMHIAHRQEMMTMVASGVLEPDRINYGKMNMGGHGHDKAERHTGKMMGMRGGTITGVHGTKVVAKPMAHDDPNSVLMEPRKSAEIVWTFGANTKLEFACNVPGHYESGMVGKIMVTN